MTRKIMDELYEELDKIGIIFTEKDSRFAQTIVIGLDYFSVSGTLRNKEGNTFIMERLVQVFKVAEKKAMFLFMKPNTILGTTALEVCFAERGLFEAIYSVRPIIGALKRNFWYFQEDAAILALLSILERFTKAVDNFLKVPHGFDSMYSGSDDIRGMVRDNVVLKRKDEVYYYMENDRDRYQLDVLHNVLSCLELAC